MQRTVLFILLVSSSLLVSAQYVPTTEDLDHFMKTKTLVVRDKNPLNTFDAEIEEVMAQEWNITEYEIIPFSEFEEKRMNPDYSFLFLTTVVFEKDKLNAKYRFLNVSMGGDYFHLNMMPDLVSVPVAYANVEDESYNYKLGILVRFIQQHLRLIHKHPEIISANVFKQYNDNMKDVKQKTLYLLENEMANDINSAAKIRDIYPYKFKLVSREDIRQAIQDRDDDVVFLHKVGPEGTRLEARCYKVLIGADDASFYYFDYHMISDKKPDGFLSKDLKKIRK
ncbi:MAG: hypothetical protein KAT31_02190 [Bacteroidales bacterium]|nr:hypothetical protein [Bacteroidales bacterium]